MKYGLIGQSLGHSFSMAYFTSKFKDEQIASTYENFELKEIAEFSNLPLKELTGLNVTSPYKQAIIPYLDELDEEAEKIGSVNTITLINGRTKGYNTDVYGFRESLRPYLRSYHDKALILGTGGASRAIAYVLNNLGIEYRFVSRAPKNDGHIAYSDLNEIALEIFPFIINATPLGTFPNVEEKPNLPYQFLKEGNFLYDLVYNPEVTAFLAAGKEKGCQTMNGKTMLHVQAEKSWNIWNSAT